MRAGKQYGRLKRGIAAYFAIVLLPVMILSALSYVSFLNKSRDDQSERIRQGLKASVETVDSAINSAQQACISIFFDQRVKLHLKPISICTVADRIVHVEIHQLISSMTAITGPMVESIFIYQDDQNVFSDGLYSFADYFDKLFVFDRYDSDFWRSLLKEKSPLTLLKATDMTRKPVMTTRAVVPMVYTTTVSGYNTVAVTTLSVSAISDMIHAGVTAENTRILIVDGDGNIVCSELTDDEYAALDLSSRTDETFRATVGETRCMMIRGSSDSTGWRYYLAVPVTQITAVSNDYLVILGVMVLLFIAVTLLAVHFSEKISSPIRRIYTAIDTGEADNAGGGKLEDFSRQVTSFLSDYREAREEEQSLRGNYVELAVLQLLSGHGAGGANQLARLLKREYGFEFPYYQLAVLRAEFNWKDEELQDTERLNLQINFKPNLIAFITQSMPCIVIEHRENQYVCLVNPAGGEDEVNRLFKKLADSLGTYDAIGLIHVGLGRRHDRIESISGEYEQIVRIIAAIPNGEKTFVGYTEDILQPSEALFSIQDEMRLMSALKNGDAEKTAALVQKTLGANQHASQAQMNLMIHELYITGMRFLAEQNKTLPDYAKYQGLHSDAEVPGGIADKAKLLDAFYQELLSFKAPVSSNSNLTDNIVTYVKENYANDLYLERIAQEMGLSVKYISKVFKGRTGRNLSDYINDVRIEHVKEMLLTTDRGVSDIGEAAGIYSRSTLLRLFRKYEGVTPSEYRDLAREKKN